MGSFINWPDVLLFALYNNSLIARYINGQKYFLLIVGMFFELVHIIYVKFLLYLILTNQKKINYF